MCSYLAFHISLLIINPAKIKKISYLEFFFLIYTPLLKNLYSVKITSLLSLILMMNYFIHSSYSQIRNAPLTAKDSEMASQNYQRYCSLCHGTEREGGAADFAPSLRSKSLMSTIPLNFLASSIGFGRPNTAMAAYLSDMGGPMSMKEIFNLASWLKYESGHETIALSNQMAVCFARPQ